MPETRTGATQPPAPAPDRGGGMRRGPVGWSRLAVWAILVTTVVAAMSLAVDLPGPVGRVAVVLFALTCPGLALVRLLRLEYPLAELSLGVAISVALAGLVGGVLLYTGMWSPPAGLAILVAVTVIALAADRLAPARRVEERRPGQP